MVVEVAVTGNGHFKGARSAIINYSVSEEATPSDPSDNSGGTGQFSFDAVEDPAAEGTLLLYGDTVELTDTYNGRTIGKVSGVSARDGLASITVDSRMNMFVTEVTALPFTGTLGDAFAYYFGLVGITTGYSVDINVASRAVAYQGFVGNLWDNLKQICSAQQVDMNLVSSNIVVRPLRTRIAETRKQSSQTINLTNFQTAQTVEINYYNNQRKVNVPIYPTNGWNTDVQVYNVNAGETLEQELPVDISLESVEQPTCVLNVDRYYNATSVYAVSGNDGLPIPPQQWIDQGGSLVASISEDRKSIIVKITGANETKYSPYSISVTAGPSDRYSSLRLRGTGVFFNKQTLTLPTGLTAADTSTKVGVTVDNPYIVTLADAYSLGSIVAGKYGSATQTINIEGAVVNRAGDPGQFNYPKFSQFDSTYAGLTFGQFDTIWAGKTFGEFDAYMNATVQDSFENQAFGNVAGARIKLRNSWYRIKSATIGPAGISYSAERDNLIADFDALWAGKTFGDFDTRWAGKTFGDFDLIAMWF